MGWISWPEPRWLLSVFEQSLVTFTEWLPVLCVPSKSFMMSLVHLPPELFLTVAAFLGRECDMNCLSQTNRRLYAVINPYLYWYNVYNSRGSALLWAAEKGIEATVRSTIDVGVDINTRDNHGSTALSCAARNGQDLVANIPLETPQVLM